MLVIRADPERVERSERARDDRRQRGSPRHHHRGHRAGAPRARASATSTPTSSRTGRPALAAMQEIAESDAAPSITRVSDARETGFSLATSKERHGFDKFLAGTVLPTLMKTQGLGKQPADSRASASRSSASRAARRTPSARRSSSTRSSRSTAAWASAPARACSTTRRSSTPRTCATSCSTGAPRATSPRRRCRGRRSTRLHDAVRRGGRQGVRRDRHPGLDHVPPVALVPLGRLPLLHLRVRVRATTRSASTTS